MKELLDFSLTGPIIGYTGLLIFILVYWLMVIIGALDFGSVDIDIDLDADIDADLDIDTDVAAAGNIGGGFIAFLKFFNFGAVPFMVTMSFVILFSWLSAILFNYYIGDGSILFSIIMIIPILFISLLCTKIFTTPLVGLFKNLNSEEDKEVDFVGRKGTITIVPTGNMLGQLKVMVLDNPILLNVKLSPDSDETVKKGDSVSIISHNESKKIYYIKKD